MMEDKDWLKGLQNKMKDYEEPAPEGLWEDIESSVFPQRKRRVVALPILWRTAAVAAVVALGVFAGLRLTDPGNGEPDKTQEILASGTPSSVISEGGQDDPVEIVEPVSRENGHNPLLAESVPSRGRSAQRTSMRFAVGQSPEQKLTAEQEPEAVTRQQEVNEYIPESFAPESVVSESAAPAKATPEEVASEAITEPVKPVEKTVTVTTGHDDEDWSGYISASNEPRAFRRKAATLDLSFSEGAMGSVDESSFDLQMYYRGSAPASAPGLIGNPGDGQDGVDRLQTRGLAPMGIKSPSMVTSKSDHRRPVRMALTANVPISGKLGLESGLMLTTLRSTFSAEAGQTLTETEQTLRYIGVPLNLTASLFDSRWFSLYLGGGGMVEKCVSGKSVTTETLAGVRQGDGVRKSFTVKPLMWSLNASAGLQANLTKRLGVYVEPGLSYHFDDKSDYQTVYRDRPLDFSLTFGARFSLR